MLVNVFDPVVDVRWFDWQYSLTSNSTFDTESKFTSVLGDLKLKGSEIYNRTLWPWGPYLAHLVLAFSLQSHVCKHLSAVAWKKLEHSLTFVGSAAWQWMRIELKRSGQSFWVTLASARVSVFIHWISQGRIQVGGGGSLLGGYSTPFRTATKTYNVWENKRKYVGHKNLVKPSSLRNAAAIDRNVVCQKFVALYPRRMMASSLLAD